MDYYRRYSKFFLNGTQTVVPFINIGNRTSDQKYVYRTAQSRLEKISYEQYGSPYFGWLIMLGNPKYGGQEWNITDGSILTIPFPLVASLQDYNNQLETHFFYYGR